MQTVYRHFSYFKHREIFRLLLFLCLSCRSGAPKLPVRSAHDVIVHVWGYTDPEHSRLWSLVLSQKQLLLTYLLSQK